MLTQQSILICFLLFGPTQPTLEARLDHITPIVANSAAKGGKGFYQDRLALLKAGGCPNCRGDGVVQQNRIGNIHGPLKAECNRCSGSGAIFTPKLVDALDAYLSTTVRGNINKPVFRKLSGDIGWVGNSFHKHRDVVEANKIVEKYLPSYIDPKKRPSWLICAGTSIKILELDGKRCAQVLLDGTDTSIFVADHFSELAEDQFVAVIGFVAEGVEYETVLLEEKTGALVYPIALSPAPRMLVKGY